ncbi:hypothetical protein BDZ91DRAFT_432140 [Kalaharituber pfeilii]|nr:hypothetical protein BDZ91DRAFT_432140 [Kalaharituber pfeilii]
MGNPSRVVLRTAFARFKRQIRLRISPILCSNALSLHGIRLLQALIQACIASSESLAGLSYLVRWGCECVWI